LKASLNEVMIKCLKGSWEKCQEMRKVAANIVGPNVNVWLY